VVIPCLINRSCLFLGIQQAKRSEIFRAISAHHELLGYVLYIAWAGIGSAVRTRFSRQTATDYNYKTASFIHKSHPRPRVRTAQVSLILQAAAAAAAGAVSITGAPSYPTTISHQILLRIFLNLSLPCRSVIQFCGRLQLTVCLYHASDSCLESEP